MKSISGFELLESILNSLLKRIALFMRDKDLRRNPIEDGAISGFSGQKSVPE